MLIDITKDSKYKKYNKDKISDFYMQDKTESAIRKYIKGIDLG